MGVKIELGFECEAINVYVYIFFLCGHQITAAYSI